MKGYMTIKPREELQADRPSIMREIIGNIYGCAAMVGDTAVAMAEGATTDANVLDLIGEQLYEIATALDMMED